VSDSTRSWVRRPELSCHGAEGALSGGCGVALGAGALVGSVGSALDSPHAVSITSSAALQPNRIANIYCFMLSHLIHTPSRSIAAEPEGYLRVFLDEGAPMAELLRAIAACDGVPAYVDRLLAAFPRTETEN